MAAALEQMSKIDNQQIKDVDIKEVQSEQTAVGENPPQSEKGAIIEQVILCVALFFPLFLATLDTSIARSFPLANS